MPRRLVLWALLCAAPYFCLAQPGRTTLLAPHIKTLRLVTDGDEERFPVIELNSSERIEVSFDDLTHEYRRYTYRIEHCDADGNPTTELFESEYVNATADEEVIDNYENSLNTSVLYTHYSFTLPNSHVRPLLSGNYRLTVSTEDEEGENAPVIQTYFGIVDKKVGIRPTCATDTEVDHNDKSQQLSLQIDCSNLSLRDASSEIHTLIMQNRRADNAVVNASPTTQNGNVLIWEHDRRLIFPAGNEYRKMEILSTRYPGMHGENVRWYAPYFHYTLTTDFPRRNYLYDEDRNGASVIRCEGSGDADTEADYVFVHYTLDMPEMADRRIFVNGRWTSTGFAPEYEMHYNAATQKYEADILQKLGYYNYMYLCTAANASDKGYTAPVEGDYFQTENEYDILVYYKPTGSRYWQMVGCVTPLYRR